MGWSPVMLTLYRDWTSGLESGVVASSLLGNEGFALSADSRLESGLIHATISR